MEIIDGKLVASKVKENVKKSVQKLNNNNIKCKLVVVLVGEDFGSLKYVSHKEKACLNVGIESETIKLPNDIEENSLIQIVRELNADVTVNGILVQLPLPKHINVYNIINEIDPIKDVDGFHPINVGKLNIGDKSLESCTPKGVMKLLNYYNIELSGANCVVIGRSNIVGKPMASMLLKEDATVTVCHAKTKDLTLYTRTADIIICAVGKANLIKGDMIKENSILIDVGISRDENNKLSGDIEFDSCKQKAKYISPVPGGVGPMTIAMLLENVVSATKKQNMV